MAYYKDLREYLEALDKAGKLVTIKSPINKDNQLSPLCFLQWRGLPLSQIKGFLFTNVTDSKGKKYDIPVAQDCLFCFEAIGLQCQPEELNEKVAQAVMHPIKPKVVAKGPVQDVVYMGDRLLEKGGLDEMPVPNTHPGWDAFPIMSASCWVTKDPETGLPNTGVYRCDAYTKDRAGIHIGGVEQDISTHWQKCRARGIPLQAAVVIGGPPNLTLCSAMKLPYGMNAYAVAGALAGEAVKMVKCKTVDLEVPANADVVIEGELSTEERMLEGPHGEGPGLESMGDLQPYFNIKCITHRKNPIWLSWASIGMGVHLLYKRLKYDLKMPHVLAVGTPYTSAPRANGGGGTQVTAIKIKAGTEPKEVWRTLEAATSGARIVVAVDEHIDITDMDMVLWAIINKSLAHRDTRIVQRADLHALVSSYMPEPLTQAMRRNQFHPEAGYPGDPGVPGDSCLLIDTTQKWPYPPMNMPKKEFMEEALKIWKKLGLPTLDLRNTWHGYELGFWPQEFAEDAERAARGEHQKTYEKRFAQRVTNVEFPLGDYHRFRDRWQKYPERKK